MSYRSVHSFALQPLSFCYCSFPLYYLYIGSHCACFWLSTMFHIIQAVLKGLAMLACLCMWPNSLHNKLSMHVTSGDPVWLMLAVYSLYWQDISYACKQPITINVQGNFSQFVRIDDHDAQGRYECPLFLPHCILNSIAAWSCCISIHLVIMML